MVGPSINDAILHGYALYAGGVMGVYVLGRVVWGWWKAAGRA